MNSSAHHEASGHGRLRHHRHEHSFTADAGGRLLAAILLNLGFAVTEFLLGFRYNSAGLLADAGHNLGDLGGLVISFIALVMLKKSPDRHFTYGYKKATVLAAAANSLLLAGAILLIVWECVEKFRSGAAASGTVIMATAGAGILVNGFTVFLLAKGRKRDLNMKSAFMHMLADTLVSLGVVVAGALIRYTHLPWIDPAVGLLIAAVILFSSLKLFRESVRLALDGVPDGIDPERIAAELEAVANVGGVHHLHIWAVSTVENALTAHVRLRDLSKLDETREELKAVLQRDGIRHATLEFESCTFKCGENCD